LTLNQANHFRDLANCAPADDQRKLGINEPDLVHETSYEVSLMIGDEHT